MDKKTIAIIGAVNIDICGTSDVQPVLHDSNPGNVNISFGGVGRNIAENLCHLGFKTEMIQVLTDLSFPFRIIAFAPPDLQFNNILISQIIYDHISTCLIPGLSFDIVISCSVDYRLKI